MQLHSDNGDIEQALAEFIAAAFSPEEREIAKIKARLMKLPPRAHGRVILQKELVEIRLAQLRKEIAA